MINDIRYAWLHDPGVSIVDKELSQYIVTDVKTNKKDINYSLGNAVIPYIYIFFCHNKKKSCP